MTKNICVQQAQRVGNGARLHGCRPRVPDCQNHGTCWQRYLRQQEICLLAYPRIYKLEDTER